MQRYILADFSWCLHRFHHAPVEMYVEDSEFGKVRTSQMFLLCQFIESVWKWDSGAIVIFCKDNNDGKGDRTVLLEGYKEGRPNSDAVYQFKNQIESIAACSSLVRFAEAPGKEADDVMARLFYRLKERDPLCEVIVYSGDNDLLQLMPFGAKIARKFKGGIFEFVSDIYVFDKYGVPPEHLLRYRVLVGDPSDKIPGLWKRMNRDHVRRFVKVWTEQGYLAALKDSENDAQFLQKIQESRELLDRNISLMNLTKYQNSLFPIELKVYRPAPDFGLCSRFQLNSYRRYLRLSGVQCA